MDKVEYADTFSFQDGLKRLGPAIELVRFSEMEQDFPCVHADGGTCQIAYGGETQPFAILAFYRKNTGAGLYSSYNAEQCRDLAAAFNEMAKLLDDLSKKGANS